MALHGMSLSLEWLCFVWLCMVWLRVCSSQFGIVWHIINTSYGIAKQSKVGRFGSSFYLGPDGLQLGPLLQFKLVAKKNNTF